MMIKNIRHVVGMIFISAVVGLVAVGCAPSSTTRSVGTTVDDATITAKVKTEIAKEQGLGEALGINVDTYRGVVSLAGFVDSQDQIDKASICARRVEGVAQVKNNLSVKPPTERFSTAARRALRAVPQIPFTQLHRLEVLNAFELLVGRGAMTREECRALQDQLQDDLANHRLVQFALDLDQVFSNACELGRAYTAKSLTRSLDLLHVAASHLALCTTFVSADDRQLAIAKATGLKVLDIKTRPRERQS